MGGRVSGEGSPWPRPAARRPRAHNLVHGGGVRAHPLRGEGPPPNDPDRLLGRVHHETARLAAGRPRWLRLLSHARVADAGRDAAHGPDRGHLPGGQFWRQGSLSSVPRQPLHHLLDAIHDVNAVVQAHDIRGWNPKQFCQDASGRSLHRRHVIDAPHRPGLEIGVSRGHRARPGSLPLRQAPLLSLCPRPHAPRRPF